MIRHKRFSFVVGLAAVASLAAVSAANAAQEPFASIKNIQPFAYACIEHKGPMADMGGVISQLMQAMQGQNVFSTVQGPMIGVYYNSPGQVKPEELIWEVGFPVIEQTAPQAPLIKKVWKHPMVAVALHVGPYAKTGETIQKLVAWVGAQGYAVDGPILERYLNNPMQVKPEELQTELWLPCKKK